MERRHDHPGLFIVCEGLGGAGVTEVAHGLADQLEKQGYRVLATSEPTNGIIGGLIRADLTGQWQTSANSLQLLFAADRAHHIETEILPALEAGKIVISNRYFFSSIAYGSVEVENPEWLSQINSQFLFPDHTFVLKVRPKVAALRLKSAHYEIELYREEQKLARVWKAYEALAGQYAGVQVVDAERDQQEIIADLVHVILDVINDSTDIEPQKTLHTLDE